MHYRREAGTQDSIKPEIGKIKWSAKVAKCAKESTNPGQ